MAPKHIGSIDRPSSSNMTEQAQRMTSIMEYSSELLDVSGRASASEKANSSAFEQRQASHSAAFSIDEDASVSSHATSLGYSTREGHREDKRSPEIAARENAQVKLGKCLVFAVLLAATATVGFLTYWYITEEEKEDYQQQVSCV